MSLLSDAFEAREVVLAAGLFRVGGGKSALLRLDREELWLILDSKLGLMFVARLWLLSVLDRSMLLWLWFSTILPPPAITTGLLLCEKNGSLMAVMLEP